MSKRDFNKYLKERYEDQVNWYDSKSILYKRLNYIFQVSTIVIGPIVPILALLDFKWETVLLSAMMAILIEILNFGKFEEKWHSYRTTCETLKKEKHYYQQKVNEYRDATDPEGLFVERVESLISREHTKWVTIEKGKKKENK
jgi:hypothetical protein